MAFSKRKLSNKFMTEEIKRIHSLLGEKLKKTNKINTGATSWVKGILEILESKTYTASNIDDIIWFYKEGLSNCKNVLDFGCGCGYLSCLISFLVNHAVGYEYLGKWLDQNLNNQDYFEAFSFCHRVVEKIRPNLEFHFYDKLPLDIKTGSFDGIMLYAAIEHIDRRILENTFLELNRLLKKNGYLFIAKLPRLYSYQESVMRLLNLPCHSNLFTKEKISDLMNKYGFKIVKIEKTGMFFNHPNGITNLFFPLTNFLEKFINRYFKLVLFFAHDYRIIAIKK